MECHYTPDQVYDMPWTALIHLTMVSDDQRYQAEKANQEASNNTEMRRMC